MKRLLSLIFIWLIIGCTPRIQREINLIELVPQNTSVVAQINDTISLKNSNILTKIFSLNNDLKKTIQNIIPENTPSPQVVFITPVGRNENVVGLIFKGNQMDSIVPTEKAIKYSGKIIETIEKEGQTFYSTNLGQLKMLSQSQLVIENGIRNFQKTQRGISSPAFYQLAKSMDEDLSINFLLHPTSVSLTNEFFPINPLFPDTGRDWIELGMEISENAINLNGVAFLNDSIPDGLILVKNMKPQKLSLSKIVPENFTSYLGFSIDNMQQLEDNFKRYSRRINLPFKGTDFSAIKSLKEISWIYVGSQKSIVFKIDDIQENFPDFLSSENDLKKFRNFSYYPCSIPEELNTLVDIFGDKIDPKWGCWYEDLLIMSETESGLKNILRSYLDRSTLDRLPIYKNLQEKLADENSFLWVGSTKNLTKYWLQNKTRKNIKNLPIEEYPLVAFQGVAENDFVHLHLSLQKNLTSNEKAGVKNAYTLQLNKRPIIPPQWFKNHRNKGMDVVVQDSDNVLYLFSNTGKLYWKKQLSGKIIGRIQQVDLYKNNRWQLAFRTADRMMILDRNGKIVKPFDIKLPKSTNPLPLSVFDYDNNRNYRFLIAQDRSLLMLNNRGKKLNGFTLKKVNANIVSPPKHIRLQSKDYILIPMENNNLKIVSRTGKDRVKVKGKIDFSENGVFSYLNTFTTSDQGGNLIQIDTKGNMVASKLNLATNHRIDATTKTLVTLSENTLNIKGIPVNLPFGEYTSPKIFYLNNTLYFSTTDISNQKVYLFYSNGEAVEGFPVYGKSAVDLSNSDKDKFLEMIVASEDNSVLIYEIN
ncbi:MAG: hypothetical protein VXX99_03740 [Bacteroidota bacterium]|nr:hypothetical protein [Bacteroidota bacterium]